MYEKVHYIIKNKTVACKMMKPIISLKLKIFVPSKIMSLSDYLVLLCSVITLYINCHILLKYYFM